MIGSRMHMLQRRAARSGAVVVEMAVTAPVLIVLFLGMWEASRLVNIRETIAVASMEGARKAVVPGANASDATQSATAACQLVGLNNVQIDTTLSSAEVTVTITARLDDNAWVTPFFFRNKTLQSTTTLKRK